jgi:acetyl esterase/lipase
MSSYTDHAYGEHGSQFVRVWRPVAASTPAAVPVVFIVHGGFWRAKFGLTTAAGTACESIAPDLAHRGLAAVEIEYRRGDDFPYPHPNDDVVAAVRFVGRRRNVIGGVNLRTDRAAMLGFSAGGQLALCAALELEPALRPVAVFAVAPVADLELAAELRLGDGGDAVVRYMGGDAGERPLAYSRACPTCRAAELAALPCQLVTVAGLNDVDVPLQLTAALRRALARRRPAQSPIDIDVPGADHYDLMDARHAAWEDRVVGQLLASLHDGSGEGAAATFGTT